LQSIKTKTLPDTEIAKQLETLFHGRGNIASQVNAFIEGVGDYGRLQKFEDVHNTGSSKTSDWERVIDRTIHRQNKDIVIGGNLTAEMIKRTALSKTSKKGDMTGRTLLGYAQKTITNSPSFSASITVGTWMLPDVGGNDRLAGIHLSSHHDHVSSFSLAFPL
jgi:hypothetical protein